MGRLAKAIILIAILAGIVAVPNHAYAEEYWTSSFEQALDSRANLFANPSFEQADPGDNTIPLGFISGPIAPAEWEWVDDPNLSFEGDRCMRFKADYRPDDATRESHYLTLNSNMPVQAGKEYVFSVWFKSKFLDETSNLCFNITNEQGIGRKTNFMKTLYERQWRRYLNSFRVKSDLDKLEITVEIRGPASNYREVYLDNFAIYEVEAFGDLYALLPEDTSTNLASLESFNFSLSDWNISQEDTAILRWGMPFAVGKVFSSDNIRVRDGNGNIVASQKRVLSTWYDDSLKWVLVDFEAKRNVTNYKVEYGTSVNDNIPGLLANDTGDRILIDTGPMIAEINKASFNLFDKVTIDTDNDGIPETKILSLSGNQDIIAGASYHSSLDPDVEVTIEENGPLRAVVLAKGHHKDSLGSRNFTHNTRIHFFKDKSYAEIHYTIINDNDWDTLTFTEPNTPFSKMQDISLSIPFNSPEANYTFGLDEIGEEHSDTYTGEEVYLLQPEPVEKTIPWQFTYDVYAGDTLVHQGQKSRGWLDVSNGNYGISTAVRYFWENAPKELGYDGTSIKTYIMPKHDDYFWIRHGAAKTHEMLIYFHPGNLSDKVRESINTFLSKPLVIISTEQYSESNVFRTKFHKYDPDKFPFYEQALNRFLYEHDGYSSAAGIPGDDFCTYNMVNFGDWPENLSSIAIGEGHYYNMETDRQFGYWMQFARTGWRDMYYKAHASSMHYMDIDTRHVSVPGKKESGYQAGGVYSGDGNNHYGWNPDIDPNGDHGKPVSGSLDHLFAIGSVYAYYLTGDNRILDVLKEMGDYYKKTGNNDFLGRQGTRSTENMIMIYDVYPDPELWNWIAHKMNFFRDCRYSLGDRAWPTLECLWTFWWKTGLPRAKDFYLEAMEISLLRQWRPKKDSYIIQGIQDHYDHRMYSVATEMARAYELTGDEQFLYFGRDNLYIQLPHLMDTTILIYPPAILYYMAKEDVPEPYSYYPVKYQTKYYEQLSLDETEDMDIEVNLFQCTAFRCLRLPVMDAILTVYYDDPFKKGVDDIIFTDHLTKRGLNWYTYTIPKDGITGTYRFKFEYSAETLNNVIQGHGYASAFQLGWAPASTALLPGDIDGDGDVDLQDLLIVAKGYGATYDLQDLLLVAMHYGEVL